MKSVVYRIIWSVVVFLVYGWINFLLNPVGTILSGQVAGKQFESSDTSYVTSVVGMKLFSDFGIPTIILLIVLVAIWWKYIKLLWTPSVVMALLVFTVIGMNAPQVNAYYDKADWPEVYFILPNESAFWIPDVGDNKKSQAKFMSEEYLRDNKIAAKRFQIPHVKLPSSAYFRDYYVPSGRLVVVDRTPYHREWVKPENRGTGKNDQSFPCQTKEGLNVTVGIAIGASVSEDNAPKFLHRFGVKSPAGNRTDPNVVFASVFYGQSLKEAMDGVVRSKVQSLVGREVSKRTFDQANSEMPQMMADIERDIKKYLGEVGITLDYIGWADTLEFDKDIQQAINDAYSAQKLAPVIATLERKAKIDTMRKWDGKLPWWMPKGLGELFDSLFGSKVTEQAKAAVKK